MVRRKANYDHPQEDTGGVLTPKHTPSESQDARLARIEEKLDGLDKRLAERCGSNVGRIESLEKSVVRLGERVGKIEAAGYRQEGGFIAISKILVIGAALGGLIVKLLEWLKIS